MPNRKVKLVNSNILSTIKLILLLFGVFQQAQSVISQNFRVFLCIQKFITEMEKFMCRVIPLVHGIVKVLSFSVWTVLQFFFSYQK
jgi:hypothetical protein